MRSFKGSLRIGLVLGAGLTSRLEAQGGEFANFILLSPSIGSAAQLYQVQTLQLEGMGGYIYGETESRQNSDIKSVVRGDNFGLNFALPFGGSDWVGSLEVYSADVEVESPDFKTTGQETELRPQLSYSPLPYLSVGLRLRARVGTQESEQQLEGGGSIRAARRIKLYVPQLSFSLHEGLWEGSLGFEPEHARSSESQNDSPATWFAHGRYALSPGLSLGLRIDWRRFGALPERPLNGGVENSDERSFSLIAENLWSDSLRSEMAAQQRVDAAGLPGNHETSLNLLALYGLTPELEAGLQIRYRRGRSRDDDYAYLPVSLIVRKEF